MALKESGHSLLIGSIFGRLEFTNAAGNHGLYPQDDKWGRWRNHSLQVVRALLNTEIEFEIIGDKEELKWLRRNNPPLYNKLQSHVVWKGKKHGSK